MSTTPTAADTTPRVWIGCLACYNEGRLVGEWFDASAADDVTTYDIHGAHSRAATHDELWCLDVENFPIIREMSPHEAAQWGRLLDEVPEHHRESFAAWVISGDFIADSDDLPCLDDFKDKYRGEWPSFVSYIEELADDIGLLANVPEELQSYFDFDRYARDCQHDYSIYDAPQGGVYVFTS